MAKIVLLKLYMSLMNQRKRLFTQRQLCYVSLLPQINYSPIMCMSLYVSLPRGAMGWSLTSDSVIMSFSGHTCTHSIFEEPNSHFSNNFIYIV